MKASMQRALVAASSVAVLGPAVCDEQALTPHGTRLATPVTLPFDAGRVPAESCVPRLRTRAASDGWDPVAGATAGSAAVSDGASGAGTLPGDTEKGTSTGPDCTDSGPWTVFGADSMAKRSTCTTTSIPGRGSCSGSLHRVS